MSLGSNLVQWALKNMSYFFFSPRNTACGQATSGILSEKTGTLCKTAAARSGWMNLRVSISFALCSHSAIYKIFLALY